MNNYMQNMNFPETDLNQLYRHFIYIWKDGGLT